VLPWLLVDARTGFGRSSSEPRFQRAIASERARLGDGPFLIVTQLSELDIDGFWDRVRLVAGFEELSVARLEAQRLFDELCADAPDGPEWRLEPILHSIPSPLAAGVPEVQLIAEHGRRVKHSGSFDADTRVVQLLEIHPAPLVGEPLFRAFNWSYDLVHYFLGVPAA
jgi:hypothetical protein